MTVAELIEELQRMPRDAAVVRPAEAGFHGVKGVETKQVLTVKDARRSSWEGEYHSMSAYYVRNPVDAEHLEAVVIK